MASSHDAGGYFVSKSYYSFLSPAPILRLRLFLQTLFFKPLSCFFSLTGLLWASPEAIRSDGTTMATKESDIYSAGIVLTEIVTRMEPYELERNNLSIEGILILKNTLTSFECKTVTLI